LSTNLANISTKQTFISAVNTNLQTDLGINTALIDVKKFTSKKKFIVANIKIQTST